MNTQTTVRRRTAMVAGLLLVALCIVPAALAQGADHPADQPLTAAADVGFAPFAMTNASGTTVGFEVDVGNEIAKRLGRPGLKIEDVNFSAIFAGLFAKRYEFIIAPTNITQERAQQMLFTEGYMDTGLGFVLKKGSTLDDPSGLKGKAVAVNNGSVSDTWATDNASKYGFTVQRYDKNADAVQAVLTGRAYANIADLPASQYAATQNPLIEVGYVVYTGRSFGYVFRKDDTAFRDRIECIVEGMKLDGTLAQIYQKWFGEAPGPDTSTSKVWAGYGMPGFPGYSADYHVPCTP